MRARAAVGANSSSATAESKDDRERTRTRSCVTNTPITRRDFVRLGAGAVAAGAVVKSTLLDPPTLSAQSPSGGRKIRFASIGTGIRGCDLLRSARTLSGGECVGIADLYTMHQKAGQEAYGADVPVTKDYRSFLDRKDIDAVIVAVADFQHRHVVIDCLEAGKDVYCEKPMSHNVADGHAMVEAVEKGKRIFQAGSQASAISSTKRQPKSTSPDDAPVTYVEAYTDRNGRSGAWVYPVAPDVSPETIDWKT